MYRSLNKGLSKITLCEPELVELQPKEENSKLKGSLDVKEVEDTSKKPIKHSTPGHNKSVRQFPLIYIGKSLQGY